MTSILRLCLHNYEYIVLLSEISTRMPTAESTVDVPVVSYVIVDCWVYCRCSGAPAAHLSVRPSARLSAGRESCCMETSVIFLPIWWIGGGGRHKSTRFETQDMIRCVTRAVPRGGGEHDTQIIAQIGDFTWETLVK